MVMMIFLCVIMGVVLRFWGVLSLLWRSGMYSGLRGSYGARSPYPLHVHGGQFV